MSVKKYFLLGAWMREQLGCFVDNICHHSILSHTQCPWTSRPDVINELAKRSPYIKREAGSQRYSTLLNEGTFPSHVGKLYKLSSDLHIPFSVLDEIEIFQARP